VISILDFGLKKQKKKNKRALRGLYEGSKFCILDKIKHKPKKIDILQFIILKQSSFCILYFMAN